MVDHGAGQLPEAGTQEDAPAPGPGIAGPGQEAAALGHEVGDPGHTAEGQDLGIAGQGLEAIIHGHVAIGQVHLEG